MIDRTGMASTTEALERRRQRRVFRSKVDTIRPTYGFEDVSLAPGTETIEPADVELAQRSAASTSRSRSSPPRWTPSSTRGFAGALAGLGGLAILNLEGVQTRYDDPDDVLERIATARRRRRPGPARRGLRRARSGRT